ncbi:hypothetical protein GCM10020331_014610 [Ectobacillus funiculus]
MCACIKKTWRLWNGKNLVERSRAIGAQLLRELKEALKNHPLVGDVRGKRFINWDRARP